MLSGVAQFESVPSSRTNGALLYNSITAKPIRGASVEVLVAASGQVLATAETDASGAYRVSIPPTDSVRVRVRAQLVRSGTPGWDFRVRDNTAGDAQYVLDSAPVSGLASASVPALVAGSGWDVSSLSYVGPRAAGVFAILDAAYEALQKILTVAPHQVWPPLSLFWSVNNRPACCDNAAGLIGTSHFVTDGSSTRAIYILGQANADTDEYDTHVVVHELGHYLQSAVSRNDSVGGQHGATDRLDMRLALSEGWGNAWSGIALDDPVYRDSLGPAQSMGFIVDVSAPPPPAQAGWYKEDSLQFVIWQVNQQLGLGPLWQALTGLVRTTDAATSAHLLAFALKQVAPAQASTVASIFGSQNITTNDAFGTGETNSGGIADALPLYRPHSGVGGTLAGESLCVTDAAGLPNKLGNYAFVRVTLAAGQRAITLAGGTNPGFEIFNATFRARSINAQPGSAQLSVNLAAGSYVIAVTDLRLAGRQCLSLTIN
jgi:hypothetical protein